MKKFFISTIFFSFFQICKAVIPVSGPVQINNNPWNPGGSNLWDLHGEILRFERGGIITGNGTIINGYIDANYNQEIFDAGINIELKPYNMFFSACWFGSKAETGFDNSKSLQKAIITCIQLKVPLFIPPLGVYSYSKPLMITYGDTFEPVLGFHMYGGYRVGSAEALTTLEYTGTGSTWALGMQHCKGVEINNLRITGQFIPPSTNNDNEFYLTQPENYRDENSLCNSDYTGIAIDPILFNPVPPGSTGLKIHDVSVTNFAVDFSISPAKSQNADILIFENIHVADSKIGFLSGYAQSKGNVVRGLQSTGRMHTLISIGRSNRFESGFWNFDGGYVSGKCIRLADFKVNAWFPIKIKDYYCENLGSVGRMVDKGSSPPWNRPAIYFQGCNFDFVWTETQQVILYTNSNLQKFESCRFRYPTHYGVSTFLYRTSIASRNGTIDYGLYNLRNCEFNCTLKFTPNFIFPDDDPVFIMGTD